MGFKTIIPLALLCSLQYANAAPAPQFPSGFPDIFGAPQTVTVTVASVTVTHYPSTCPALPTSTPGSIFAFGGQGSTESQASGGGIVFPDGFPPLAAGAPDPFLSEIPGLPEPTTTTTTTTHHSSSPTSSISSHTTTSSSSTTSSKSTSTTTRPTTTSSTSSHRTTSTTSTPRVVIGARSGFF